MADISERVEGIKENPSKLQSERISAASEHELTGL